MLSRLSQIVTNIMTPISKVVEACEIGDVDVLKKYINDYNINSLDDEGYYIPLHIACEQGQIEVVKFLMSFANLDVNKVANKYLHSGSQEVNEFDSLTALYIAVLKQDVNIVNLLCSDSRTNVNFVINFNPLYVNTEEQMWNKAVSNIRQRTGHSTLSNNRSSTLELPRGKRADLQDYNTPLTVAISMNSDSDIINTLISFCDCNLPSQYPALWRYYDEHNDMGIRTILTCPNVDIGVMKSKRSFIQTVINNRDNQLLKFIIQQTQVDINKPYFANGKTLLHELTEDGNVAMVKACLSSSSSDSHTFSYSKPKLDINLTDNFDKQAIEYAISYPSILRLFLDRDDLQVYNPHKCLVTALESGIMVSLMMLIADDRFNLLKDISTYKSDEANYIVRLLWQQPQLAREQAKSWLTQGKDWLNDTDDDELLFRS
jgi:ankyrin repeat protein